MMNQKAKCTFVSSCEQALAYRFIRIARWVALALLVGIGLGGWWAGYQRQDINWLFVGVCVSCGVLLFWMGSCILRSECQRQRSKASCPKEVVLQRVPSVKLS